MSGITLNERKNLRKKKAKEILHKWWNLDSRIARIVAIIGQYNHHEITDYAFWEKIHQELREELTLYYEQKIYSKEYDPLRKLVKVDQRNK